MSAPSTMEELAVKLDYYQNKAITLAAYPSKYEIAYTALGIVDEVGELLRCDADAENEVILSECGDVVWYCSALAYDLGLTLWDCYDCAKIQAIPDIQALFENSTRLAGRVKKILRGDPDQEGKVKEVRGYIGDILRRIEVLAIQRGASLETVCDMNLDKLFDRKDRGVLKGDGDKR